MSEAGTGMPPLVVLGLSDSFRTVWSDLADELQVQLLQLDASAAPGVALAVIIAAGGEEEHALDLLASGTLDSVAPRYLIGAQPSHRFAVEAIRRGATDYFALPGDLDLLRRTLGARADAARQRPATRTAADSPSDPFRSLLGGSPALLDTLERARKIARHGDVTVLITGETGTGKELLAHAVHLGSPRAAGPFVAINCAAIPAQLLESELFGHERGAFTDARQAKPGLFEEADGGTVFLDEIGHLPLALQGKLLRALEEKRIRRVGATQSRPADARIIAATHVDLDAAVAQGEFREDLFYRLNVVRLVLPPLKDRGDDILLLSQAFAQNLAQRYRLAAPRLSAEVRGALMAYAWPGNVRELHHAVERALLLSDPGTIDPRELIPARRPTHSTSTASISGGTLAEIIRVAVQDTLARHTGNKSAAARELGISRQRLQRLLDHPEDES